jgi:UDP-3-O-[3-hydroxymyristoyl] glucosamine N-acyltransferase
VSKQISFKLEELAKLINGKVVGDTNAVVDNLSTIQNANSSSITFLSNAKYIDLLNNSKASAVVVDINFREDSRFHYIKCNDPYIAYAQLSKIFKNDSEIKIPFIHKSATISKDAEVHESVYIGPNVYVGPNCKIYSGVEIHANCSLVKDVIVGSHSIIHHGTILGSEGFGYAPSDEGYVKIEQLGGLSIGKNVEIGANCTIDRGALDDTQIHDGVKLDNLVHIAHNVVLGKNSAIAASCAIAGSSIIGENFQMGGLSGVLGHLSICNDVTVGAHTLITKNIEKSGNYVGIMPAQKHQDWAKSSVLIKKLSK